MRLNRLYIDGFGRFRDYGVGPLDRKVTVLHGPNEAGKSTLLAFIRTILFGFPLRGRDDFYPPLAGGRHGGRITLMDDDGVKYRLERFAGPRGGHPVLRTESGEPKLLERLIGNATLNLFSNVFAFSLDEIQRDGLMNDSDVSGRLYSVGMGASGLPELSKSLADRRNGIFRPRGSAQKIPGLLQELNDVDGRLRAIQLGADDYRRLTARQEIITQELGETSEEISRMNLRLLEVGKLVEGWDDWVALVGMDTQLQELPKIKRMPESPIDRLEAIEKRIRQATEDRNESARELSKMSEVAEAIIPGENLLAGSERIEAIRRGRSRFDDSVHDLPERKDELREMERELSDRLLDLGSDWEESRLDGLDTSLAVRQQVEAWRDDLNKSLAVCDAAAVSLEQATALLEKLKEEEHQAQSRLQVDSALAESVSLRPASGRLEDLLKVRENVERVRRGRSRFDDSVRDLPERRAELRSQEGGLAKQLRDLGRDWGEPKLEAFDTSLVFRKEIDGFRQELADQSARIRSSADQLEREHSELEERRTALKLAQGRMPAEQPVWDAHEIGQRRSALRTTRSRLNEHERASLNLENLRGQLTSLTGNSESAGRDSGRSLVLLPILLGVAGIVLLLAGLYLGEDAMLMGTVAGLVLLGVAAYLLVRSPASSGTTESPISGTLAREVGNAEVTAERAKALLGDASQPLALDESPTADVLDNVEAELDAASSTLSAWNESNLRVEEARLEFEAQERRIEQAGKQKVSAVESEISVKDEWRQWLERHGLDDGLTPEGVVELMGSIETTRAVLEGVRVMRRRVSAIEVDIEEYEQMVQPLAETFGISIDGNSQQRVMEVADTLIESLDAVQRLVVHRDDVLARLHLQEQVLSTASDEHTSASRQHEDRQKNWHRWLRERELDVSFKPDTLLEFLARADTARTRRTATRSMRERVSAIEKDINRFRKRVAPLARNHGLTPNVADPLQLAMAADTLIARIEDVRTKVSERDQVRQHREQQRQRFEQMERRLRSAEEDIHELVGAADASDAEDFRRRAALYAQRQELEKQCVERLNSLRRLSGPNGRLTVFRDSLASADPDLLQEESRVLAEQINDLNLRRDELHKEHGGNATEINRLAAEEESSDLRIRRNILMEQLCEDAREWSRLTIAEIILERTQRKFELERQPSVIQHAEEFFSNVTGHRYTRLYAPVAKKTITVTDSSGQDRRPDQLSRGTREQLYLALRFGLIREFGEHTEHLPVVVDEALVNFDPERASLAVNAFSKLSETNQVLVFTCHRTVADMFADVGAQVLDVTEVGP